MPAAPCLPRRRSALAALAAAWLAWPAASASERLPAEVARALQRAQLPPEALAVVVQEAGTRRPLLAWNDTAPVNPASLAKLVTTAAALDLLGPAWTWSTPVWITGPVGDGVLDGSVVIQGSGDPTLVLERVWLLLRRVQQAGVREIRGDIVLDGSAFAAPAGTPGDFDGEPMRPYNVQPDALLLNFKAVRYGIVPDPARGVARISAEPPLAGSIVDAAVPLAPGPCGDWQAALKPSFADPARIRFAGSYPAACGEQLWSLADADPASYNHRLIAALWQAMGGRLHGSVRSGSAPPALPPSFELRSPALAEAVRDINKHSNNPMAEQLALTLARQRDPTQPATAAAARELLQRWLVDRVGESPADVVADNGSGLSRSWRITPRGLAALLQLAWDAPWMPELMASLPIPGADGTLRRASRLPGRAHLKTGSLRDVAGVAGYVLSHGARRYVVVAIANHPRAFAARPAIDAVVDWALRDAPGAEPSRRAPGMAPAAGGERR